MINSLHNAMMEGHGKDQIKETLQELLNYTIDHFAREEKLMLESNYPHYREHKPIEKIPRILINLKKAECDKL